ncbi:hypothetical protein [Streptomyces violaceus]|uniref:Uncharacterized protein n=1 Tax=Streptomyces violaceus TaxID=1936 RepID=A0ABZ1NNG1_STRVL
MRWQPLRTPHLPLESQKLSAHLAEIVGKDARGPIKRLLSPLPLHELFAQAAAG